MKNKIIINNGLIFNGKKFRVGSVQIKKNKITDVRYDEIDIAYYLKKGYSIIDAEDSIISYGFFDPHVHFRSPGAEYKEDWHSGVKAAISGGFTFVCDMPNNTPSAVSFEILNIKTQFDKQYPINYGLFLGLTDNNSNNLTEIIRQCKANKIPLLGIKCFIGSSTGDLLVNYYKSIYDALNTGLITLIHCEDEQVLKKYDKIKYTDIKSHNEKRPSIAEVSGLKKIINASSKIKDFAKIYICHISSKSLMKEISKNKKNNFNIITEVSPHHLFFSLSEIENSNIYKVNPPIRDDNDVIYLRKSFNKGRFNIIGSDHAPHLLKEKLSDNPPSGIPGLETSFYALYNLYERKILNLNMIFKLLTSGYKIFNIKKRGKIKKGYFADLTIIKKQKNVIKSENLFTKADFTPYENLETDMKVNTVIINGSVVYNNSVFL